MEGERTRSEKESAGDDFKLLVSQADISSSTQCPLYLQYHLHLFCFICLSGVATLGVRHYVSHPRTAASDTVCIYIIPLILALTRTKSSFTFVYTFSLLTYFILLRLCFSFLTLCLSVSFHTLLMPLP